MDSTQHHGESSPSELAAAAQGQERSIGAQLANVAFNWAQREGHVLTAGDCAMLDKLRRAWDEAPTSPPPASEQRWIPVSERLPEKFTEVLVAFAENSLPSTGQYTANDNDHDGWCYPRENADWSRSPVGWPTVTHWMLLPDHPNEAAFAIAATKERT